MNAHRSFLAASLFVTMLVAMPTTGNTAVDPYPNGCVSCHKLNVQTGEWSMPSGPEK
jgi:cytochrome c551/c552